MIVLKCLCYICCMLPLTMAMLFNDFVDLYDLRNCWNDKHLIDVKIMTVDVIMVMIALTIIIEIIG